jgi:hypothetical protein
VILVRLLSNLPKDLSGSQQHRTPKFPQPTSAASGTLHDSGYDAFLTGSVFVRALTQLGFDQGNVGEVRDLRKMERDGVEDEASTVPELSPLATQLMKHSNTLHLAARCAQPAWDLRDPAASQTKQGTQAYTLYITDVVPTLTNDDIIVRMQLCGWVELSGPERRVSGLCFLCGMCVVL